MKHSARLCFRFSLLALAAAPFLLAGCITHRTVTKNGRVIAEGPALKRPVRDAIVHSKR